MYQPRQLRTRENPCPLCPESFLNWAASRFVKTVSRLLCFISLQTLMIFSANTLDFSCNGLPISTLPFVSYFFTIHYYLITSPNTTPKF